MSRPTTERERLIDDIVSLLREKAMYDVCTVAVCEYIANARVIEINRKIDHLKNQRKTFTEPTQRIGTVFSLITDIDVRVQSNGVLAKETVVSEQKLQLMLDADGSVEQLRELRNILHSGCYVDELIHRPADIRER